jgi:lipoprotein-releasing system ATP-binding protein
MNNSIESESVISPMEQTQKPILECKTVTKDYIDGDSIIKVLLGIELSVIPGEQIAIIGRSGSGKTTLLQLLGGLDKPTTGEVWMKSQNVHALNERKQEQLRNKTLGFIYQLHHLLPEFTALENVAMPLLIGDFSISEAKRRAADMLDQVGLSHRLTHRPSELSGGERQRVAIARALVNKPDCILADEPTGNLDAENANHVFEVMQTLNRQHNTSIIIVTHDIQLAQRMDRILELQNGHLRAY